MDDKKRDLSDNLTVLIFKDSFATRTFRVPLRWITQIGTGIGILVLISVLSGILAIRFYWSSRMASPARVQELEIELQDLKASLMPQKKQAAEIIAASPEAIPSPEPSADVVSVASTQSISLSQLFPQARLADPNAVSVGIHSPRVAWEGKTLVVNFAIQYRKEDGKNQQGKIVILVYGPEALLTYPMGILNFSGKGGIISPEKGEYFSVSRFREVKAKFGPVASTETLKNIDIFLFETNGTVLLHQNFKPGLVKVGEPSPRAVLSPLGTE